ncbi:S-layer homology domain-containing protein [Patescibacteria group bacterium]|nr:S-layer homology domain-containing protein [Patescibacteria group bacterium]
MKKLIFLGILFCLIPLSLALAFSDTSYNVNEDAINYLQSKGVVQGYSDGTYRPYNSINRAEFTKIVMESVYPGGSAGGGCFPDVLYDWYAPYVCSARTLGIISGYPDGYFRPNNNINLAEALKIVLEAYNFDVGNSYSVWYENYFWFAKPKGLLNGMNENVSHYVSRGEMAQLIYNVEMYLDGKPVPSPEPEPIGKFGVFQGEINSCTQTEFNSIYVLLVQNMSQATSQRINWIRSVKDEVNEQFPFATEYLASMDADDEIVVMQVEDGMFDENLNFVGRNVVTRKLYETHDDDYDFVVVYTAFDTPFRLGNFVAAQFNTFGLQIDPYVWDNTEDYGSDGRLKGVVFGTYVDFMMEEPMTLSDIVLHEFGHYWCCYFVDINQGFSAGHSYSPLEIFGTPDTYHFYSGLETGFENGSIMLGSHWIPNGNGTYSESTTVSNLYHKKYHPFVLYMMGLLPESEYGTEYPVYDRGHIETHPDGSADVVGWTSSAATLYDNISVNDIIEVAGERRCAN